MRTVGTLIYSNSLAKRIMVLLYYLVLELPKSLTSSFITGEARSQFDLFTSQIIVLRIFTILFSIRFESNEIHRFCIDRYF